MISTGGDFEMPMVEQPLVRPSWRGIAAIAAAGDLVHDVVAAARRIVAAEREIAAGAGRRGRHLVRQRLHHRREHRLGDALRHLRRAARDRARIFRVEEGAFRPLDDQRLEGAGADRHVREDVAHGEIDRRQRGGEHAVHRPGAGRRLSRRSRRSAYRRPSRWRARSSAARRPRRRNRRRPSSGRCRRRMARDMRAHLLGRAAAQFGDRRDDRFVAVAVEDREQPLLPDLQRRGLRRMSPMRWSAMRMLEAMMA